VSRPVDPRRVDDHHGKSLAGPAEGLLFGGRLGPLVVDEERSVRRGVFSSITSPGREGPTVRQVEVQTTRRTPNRAAASNTLRAPCTFTSKKTCGSGAQFLA